jgi:competence ComEA-like helix-hairpin-helix protein
MKPSDSHLTGQHSIRLGSRFRLADRIISQVLIILASLILPISPAAVVQDSPLPAGAGKPLVEKVCSGCHELDTVIMVRRTKTGWEEMVSDMADRGARGTDKELSAVVQYLSRFFGKINVNTASAKDLEQFLGLEGKVTQGIVDYREKNGKFKDFEQLKQTPGINAEQLQEKRQLIAFNQ